MNLKKFLLLNLFFAAFFISKSFGQSISIDPMIRIKPPQANFTQSIYIDSYYAFYNDSVGQGNFQKFPSVSPRSNAFGLNTAMINMKVDAMKFRAEVTLHFGDIAKSTWSPGYQNIMEAHAGIRLCNNNKLWADVGIFRTHFGTEGLLPKENFTSSVSVGTYYEPYYESGLRLKYTPNDKWVVNIYLLNGYNVIEDNNNKKSLGALIVYSPNDKGNIGYSNYIGDDSPVGDSISHLLVHQNLFWNYRYKKFFWQIGGDYCEKQNSHFTKKELWASMFSGVASLKFQCCTNDAIYARYEIFQDPQGIMSGIIIDKNGVNTGYNLWGATLGVEYKPTTDSYIRLEARQLQMDSAQEIFHWKNKNTNARLEILLNLGITF